MKLSRTDTFKKSKFGIDLEVYPTHEYGFGLVRIETKEGHFEEFYHKTSTFTYYVFEGTGTFYLDGVPYEVVSGDVIVARPLTTIYYLGTMKLILITTPAWTEEDEVHVRDIEK